MIVFFPGHHHIPQISNCIIKAQFSLSHALADISNFYTNHQLDEQGALLSAVLLQTPPEGSIYPTLDPNRDVPLQLFIFVGAKFGYKDSGSLAGLAKSLLTKIYHEKYPKCIHKIPKNQLEEVKSTLVNSYVDDISVNTTVADLHKELNNPTLIMDSKNPFSSLPVIEQAALLTVAKTQRVLAILDFSGFSAKQVK